MGASCTPQRANLPLPPGGGNPLAPGGARPRTPQRAKLLAAEGGNYNPSEGRVSPPAAHRRIGGAFTVS